MLIALGRTLEGIKPSAVAQATFAAAFRIGGGLALAWVFCELAGFEGAMRRNLSETVKERVMQVGLVFLIAFMSVIIFLDVVKIL